MISKSRWMTIHEIAGLQGMPSWVAGCFLRKGISETILGRALGDAMSLNVLMRVLPRALCASGVLQALPNDVWADPVLRDRVSSNGTHMPDSLLRRK